MNICILESLSSINPNGVIDAHVRQAITLTRYLQQQGHDVCLLDGDSMQGFSRKNLDVIIKSYASFYENHEDAKRIVEANPSAKLFWLINEYDLNINGNWRRFAKSRGLSVIANFPDKRDLFNQHFMVNMNALFYRDDRDIPSKKYDICYYGTYRKNRAVYFKKYFCDKSIFLSTSSKNHKKFRGIGCEFTPVDKFKWSGKYDTLGYFKYSLYIEDVHTHKLFNNLADRFYEALSNKTVIVFDRSCENTLDKSEIAGFGWQDFIVDSLDDIKNRDYDKDIKAQQKWIPVVKAEKENALKTLETIITQ